MIVSPRCSARPFSTQTFPLTTHKTPDFLHSLHLLSLSLSPLSPVRNRDAWLANQTEIVYAVFVDGKPVLAATAAADMQLVSKAEVAHVMDQMVYTKAERNLPPHLSTSI